MLNWEITNDVTKQLCLEISENNFLFIEVLDEDEYVEDVQLKLNNSKIENIEELEEFADGFMEALIGEIDLEDYDQEHINECIRMFYSDVDAIDRYYPEAETNKMIAQCIFEADV